MNRIDDFVARFKDAGEISKEDIYEYFHATGKTKDESIKSLLSRWTKQGALSRVKKSTYIVNEDKKKLFKISADTTQKRLSKIFLNEYSEITYSIWNSNILNNLMRHQYFNTFYIFETESDVVESAFYLFKDSNLNVFLETDYDIINRYITGSKTPIVLKKITSRSPLEKKGGVPHPTIEKLLVDVFVDTTLFNFAQGSELINIYNEVFDYYVVNITTLLNYADRRNAKENIQAFIRLNVTNPQIISLL